MWAATTGFYLFCETGVYKLKDNVLNENVLGHEMSKNLYILANANTSDQEIPLISAMHNFRPTLIYIESP